MLTVEETMIGAQWLAPGPPDAAKTFECIAARWRVAAATRDFNLKVEMHDAIGNDFSTRFSTERRTELFGTAAARLLRTYVAQVEAFRRLRHGGSQIVRVEHVHVNEGGQAVIGNVSSQP